MTMSRVAETDKSGELSEKAGAEGKFLMWGEILVVCLLKGPNSTTVLRFVVNLFSNKYNIVTCSVAVECVVGL